MSDNILPANTDTCLVEFDKKEYAIVGDVFFAKTLEEVPPWFLELIQDTVVSINGSTYDALAQYNISLLAALQSIEISKNTYEQYINKLITDQEAFISVLTTLNASINDNDASIRQLLLTYATEDFAVASAAQLLTASINGGAIGAAIGSVETAMATQYGAMAQRLQVLESTFEDVAGQQEANASAIQKLTTYTGYGVYNGADALIANSNFYSNLNAYLVGTDYSIGGSSTLLQDVTAISTEQAKIVEAKFEYGSKIELDGKVYNAGFGLVQTGTLLPDGTTYDSEFWVRASKFKFVNDTDGVMTTPFQIVGNTVLVGWDSVTGTNRPADGATRNVNRGEWKERPTNPNYYMQGDFVQHEGSSYTCILSTIPGSASPLPTNTSYWTLLASQGVPGTNARAVNLAASNGGVFTYNSAGQVPTPTSTTITATAVNTTGTVYYEYFVDDVSVKNSTSNTYSLAAPANIGSSKVEVQIREGTSTSSVLARDQLTVVGIKPGVNAFTVILTNEAHTLPVSNGVVTYTGSGTEIKVYEGTTALTYASSGNSTFSVTAVGTGITVGTNTNGVFGDHSNMTANSATITYTITIRSSTGAVSTMTKVQSLAKSLQGLNTAIVNIYYTNSSSTVAPTAAISGTFTYTFSTNTLSGGTFNGWSTTLPTATNGKYIWVRQATATSTTNTDTIDVADFSTAVCLSGTGLDGLNFATVTLYRTSTSNTTAPTAPTGTFTYTFSTKALTGGVLNGWSTTYPTVNKGEFLWAATATASATTATDNIEASEFVGNTKVISGVGADGSKGATGSRGASTANKTVTTALGSYTAYDSDFAAVTGFSDRIKGDTLIVTSSHSTDGGTKTWIRDATGSTSWTNYAWAVNGNALINGTLTASKITAGHIGSVLGVKVNILFGPSNVGSNENLEFSPGSSENNKMRYYWYHGRSGHGTVMRALVIMDAISGAETVGPLTGYTKTPNVVGQVDYTNPTTVPVNVQLLFFGRTGFRPNSSYLSGSSGGTMFITKVVDGVYTTIGNYGWSPMEQDSKSFSAFDTVAPGKTVSYLLESYRGYNIPINYSGGLNLNVDTYYYGLSGTFTLTGVIS